MESNESEKSYLLIAPEQFEELVKSQFMLSQSMLLFEYLCSRCDYPLFLSAQAACEVLGIKKEVLEMHRRQRTIRPRIYQRQFLYSAYDLVALSAKLNHKRIQRALCKIPRVVVK